MGSKQAYKSFYQNLKEVTCKWCGSSFVRENPNMRFCKEACRFYDKVDSQSEWPCQVWTGNKYKKGYGTIKVLGKNLKAHRYSYQIHIGDIPEGMMVLHSCDNPSCVNPEHLRAGDAFDNASDMVERNRQATGERHARWNPNSPQHKYNPSSPFYDPN
jgi:hypothetical protein